MAGVALVSIGSPSTVDAAVDADRAVGK